MTTPDSTITDFRVDRPARSNTFLFAALILATMALNAMALADAARLRPGSGATVNGVFSYAFPFVAERSGYLQRVTANIEVAQSIAPDVIAMLNVHYDRDGTVIQPFAEMMQSIHKGTPGTKESVFESPSGVQLEKGRRYWLMLESPTGNELVWLETDKVGPRFSKNVVSGKQTYDEGPQAAFNVVIAESP